MLRRIGHLLIKELTQIRRDRRLLGLLVMTPMIQLLVLGFAATTDISSIHLSVRDHDATPQSRAYVQALVSSGYFIPRFPAGPPRDDGAELVNGRAGLVLVIPRGFGARLLDRRTAPVQVLVDGADSNFAVHGLNYLQQASRLYSAQVMAGVLARAASTGVRTPAVTMATRVWFNPALTSRYHMIPAMMGVLLMVTTMIVTSMTLVKEREEGTMEQLLVTPLRPGELIAGKLLPFLVIGALEVTICLPIMLGVYGVPLRGHLGTLYLLSADFLLTTLGLGLFVSLLVRTQQQAMMAAAFFVMMPFVLLSGFIFPVENMPHGFQLVAECIPLKHYLVCVRALFLKAAGWPDLQREALILLGTGLGILSLAILRFRKTMD